MRSGPEARPAVRLASGALAVGLVAVVVLAIYWVTLEWRLAGLRELSRLSRGGEIESLAELERGVVDADALTGAILEHADYHYMRSRLHLALGQALEPTDPVAAFRHYEQAEQSSLTAHQKRPHLPHDLLRAAAARAERYLVDDRFLQYLVEANRLGPWDRGTATTTFLLVMEHFDYVPEAAVEVASDAAVRALLAGGYIADLMRLLNHYDAWALVCVDERVVDRHERRCAAVRSTGGG